MPKISSPAVAISDRSHVCDSQAIQDFHETSRSSQPFPRPPIYNHRFGSWLNKHEKFKITVKLIHFYLEKNMTNDELIAGLEFLRNTMISVATGGPRIEEMNERYQRMYATVVADLSRRGIANTMTYGNLWDWYGRWSSGDLPTYQSRRLLINELISPLINSVLTGRAAEHQPTGWQRVDRTVGEIRDRLAASVNEEQFQAVGLLCRDLIISLAQSVYVRSQHPPLDSVEPSQTDGNRMLEAYIAVELAGGANEAVRRHAKAALTLANDLTHRRTATFRDAAMCVEASTTVTNVIAILAGKRDPQS
ncbi:MAG: hypothetical protein V4640_14930 [Verrucomicrobiota bacterium]